MTSPLRFLRPRLHFAGRLYETQQSPVIFILACVAWLRVSQLSLPGSSRLWRSLSRLSHFASALKLLKNRQATQWRSLSRLSHFPSALKLLENRQATQATVILDLCLNKNSGRKITWLSRRAPFSKRKADFVKFVRFDERHRKTSFSWRISVDDRPNRRNKPVFKFLRGGADEAQSSHTNVFWRAGYLIACLTNDLSQIDVSFFMRLSSYWWLMALQYC